MQFLLGALLECYNLERSLTKRTLIFLTLCILGHLLSRECQGNTYYRTII